MRYESWLCGELLPLLFAEASDDGPAGESVGEQGAGRRCPLAHRIEVGQARQRHLPPLAKDAGEDIHLLVRHATKDFPHDRCSRTRKLPMVPVERGARVRGCPGAESRDCGYRSVTSL